MKMPNAERDEFTLQLLAPFVSQRGRCPRQPDISVFDGRLPVHKHSVNVDCDPLEGKIIALTDTHLFVKTGKNTFAKVLKSLVTPQELVTTLSTKSKVRITPYFRRRLDGTRSDKSLQDSPCNGFIVTKSKSLFHPETHFDFKDVQSYALTKLIEHLETTTAPDGYRYLTHLLVDAGATDFSIHDSGDEFFPCFMFKVSNQKVKGEITICWLDAMNTYDMKLAEPNRPEKIISFSLHEIGAILEDWLDDGQWKLMPLEILPTGKTSKSSISRP